MDTLPSLREESNTVRDSDFALFSQRLSAITQDKEKLTAEELRVLLSLSTGAEPSHIRAVLKLDSRELKQLAFLGQAKIGKV